MACWGNATGSGSIGYTLSMKTAISLPDGLFERAEEYARRAGWSRSRLVREALTEYLLRHDADAVTTAINEVVDELGDGAGPWVRAASRRRLEDVEW